VSVSRFSDSMDELIKSGMPRQDVVPVLLAEEGWSPEMDGVEMLDPKDWAPTLWFDIESYRFVGTRLAVTLAAFRRRQRELQAAGMPMAEAITDLRQERQWALGMPGVQPAFTAAEAIAATERLIRSGAAN
ncbi:MAG: hypothetical protein ACYDCQ_21985, partial [Dehalococcoidia bacterium]